MTRLKSSWKPVLFAQKSEEAWKIIRQIDRKIDTLEKKLKAHPSFRIFTAGHGAALFSQYLYLETGDKKKLKRAHSFLNIGVKAVGTLPATDDLFSGITGVAWLVEHIRRVSGKVWTRSQDPNREIDEYLLSKFDDGPELGAYGLCDQWIGYGVYGLERLSKSKTSPLLKRISLLLNQKAESSENRMAWLSPQGYYNLGLAHGIAGIIAYLAAILKKNKGETQVRDTLYGAIAWLESENKGGHYSYFRSHDPEKDKLNGAPRLAWCYGDLGIAVALYSASKVLNDSAIEARALALAKRATLFTESNARVLDCYFCHGGIGAFHIFNRFYQWTADGSFLKAAMTWYEVAIKLRKKDGPSKLMNVLTGEIGLGLSLLGGVSNVSPDWDRYLLISNEF